MTASHTGSGPASAIGGLWATVLAALLVSAAGCADPYDASGPSDTVAYGALCAPATADCPSRVTLRRDGRGANQLDFRIENTGAAAASVVVEVRTEAAELDAGADADTDAGGQDGESVLVEQTYAVGAGESVADRLTQDQLLTTPTVFLEMRCEGCQVRLEYALSAETIECRSDEECSGTWLCDSARGRCVECLSNGDCASGQTCDEVTRQCKPPSTTSCASAAPSPPASLWLWALVLTLAVVARRWRRRGAASLAALALAVALGGVLVGVLAPGEASAQGMRAKFSAGAGPRYLTGELGDLTKRGIGVTVEQELRSRWAGGVVQLSTSYYLTTQQPPPLSHEFQMYSVLLGPRGYLRLGPIELAAGPDVRRVGLVTNSLVRQTGPEINYLAVGGTLETRYLVEPFELLIRFGYHPIFGLDGGLVSIDVAAGLAP